MSSATAALRFELAALAMMAAMNGAYRVTSGGQRCEGPAKTASDARRDAREDAGALVVLLFEAMFFEAAVGPGNANTVEAMDSAVTTIATPKRTSPKYTGVCRFRITTFDEFERLQCGSQCIAFRDVRSDGVDVQQVEPVQRLDSNTRINKGDEPRVGNVGANGQRLQR